MYNYLIENGLILSSQKTEKKTIGLLGEKIHLLEPGHEYEAEAKLDATGCYILPGLVDPHVHPNYEDSLAQTSISAVYGGVTTVLHYIPIKAGENPLEKIRQVQAEGETGSVIDFGLHAAFFDTANQLSAIKGLSQLGVRSFKMFTAYARSGWLTPDAVLLKALAEIASAEGLACVHAESGAAIEFLEERLSPLTVHNFLATSPALLDKEAIWRTLCYAKIANCPLYLPHISSRKALEALALAKEEGIPFYSETCPHYLAFSWEDLKSRGPQGKLRPPIKTAEDREALWNALEDLTIHCIGSDHAPKAKLPNDDFHSAPFGAPGVETILPVLWELGVNANHLTPFDLVRLCCENPAKIFGLFPRKGQLAEGSDADLIIFDPTQKWQLSQSQQHSKAPYTLYEGLTCRGKILKVFVRGRLVVDNDKLCCQGGGRFLRTEPGKWAL